MSYPDFSRRVEFMFSFDILLVNELKRRGVGEQIWNCAGLNLFIPEKIMGATNIYCPGYLPLLD